jgi:hypothetical protein
MIYEYGRMLSGSTKGSLRRGKNIGENTDGPAKYGGGKIAGFYVFPVLPKAMWPKAK